MDCKEAISVFKSNYPHGKVMISEAVDLAIKLLEAEALKPSHNNERVEICPECDSKMLMNPAGNWYCSNWPWCQGKLSPVS